MEEVSGCLFFLFILSRLWSRIGFGSWLFRYLLSRYCLWMGRKRWIICEGVQTSKTLGNRSAKMHILTCYECA